MRMVSYYTNRNAPKFDVLLADKERLPDLVKVIGLAELGSLVMAEVSKFVNCYTVVRPMGEIQISECALAIIQSSEEDYLSLQDIVVFFEGAKMGKYGRVLDHIDQHVIFEMLEVYREQRHQTFKNIQYEKESQYKTSSFERMSEEKEDPEIMKAILDNYKQSVLNKK